MQIVGNKLKRKKIAETGKLSKIPLQKSRTALPMVVESGVFIRDVSTNLADHDACGSLRKNMYFWAS